MQALCLGLSIVCPHWKRQTKWICWITISIFLSMKKRAMWKSCTVARTAVSVCCNCVKTGVFKAKFLRRRLSCKSSCNCIYCTKLFHILQWYCRHCNKKFKHGSDWHCARKFKYLFELFCFGQTLMYQSLFFVLKACVWLTAIYMAKTLTKVAILTCKKNLLFFC